MKAYTYRDGQLRSTDGEEAPKGRYVSTKVVRDLVTLLNQNLELMEMFQEIHQQESAADLDEIFSDASAELRDALKEMGIKGVWPKLSPPHPTPAST